MIRQDDVAGLNSEKLRFTDFEAGQIARLEVSAGKNRQSGAMISSVSVHGTSKTMICAPSSGSDSR